MNLRLGRSPKILVTSFGGFFLPLRTAAAGNGDSPVAVNTRHIASLQNNNICCCIMLNEKHCWN